MARCSGRVHGAGVLVPAVALALAIAPCDTRAGEEGGPAAEAATMASLAISSRPEGAEVLLDGAPRGRSPLAVPALAPGRHELRLRLAGHLETRRTVHLVAGGREAVEVPLTPAAEEPEAGRPGRSRRKLLLVGLPVVAAAGGAAYVVTSRNQAPSLDGITVEPSAGRGIAALTSYRFSAAGARDEDGDDLVYAWDFGDGTFAAGSMANHTFAQAGSYLVKLAVSDRQATSSVNTTVSIVSLSGTWTGSLTNCPNCAIFPVIQLTQGGAHLSGTYSDYNGQAYVDGTVTAPRKVDFLTGNPAYRVGRWSGTLSDDGTMIDGTVDWFPTPFSFRFIRR